MVLEWASGFLRTDGLAVEVAAALVVVALALEASFTLLFLCTEVAFAEAAAPIIIAAMCGPPALALRTCPRRT